MEKSRVPLNVTGGYRGANLAASSYGNYPVKYSLIEDMYQDMDNMDIDVEKAINSTSTKVNQVGHGFEVLQPIYFDTSDGTWKLAKADDSDTVGTHLVVKVIDVNYFIAGLNGIFELKSGLDAGYYFTSDTEAGALVDTAPDINNPMVQVLDANNIRLLDVGIISDLQDERVKFGRTIETATATLALTDNYKIVNGDFATAITITIPEGTFSKGDWGNIQQIGAGEVVMEVANATNQFINDEVKTGGQYKWITWLCEDDTTDAEVFKIIGGIE